MKHKWKPDRGFGLKGTQKAGAAPIFLFLYLTTDLLPETSALGYSHLLSLRIQA
jgi:hypothetical protein